MALAIALVYFVALIIVASLYTRKKVKTAADFADAGGQMGWVLVTFAFVLAPLGSGHTMSLWEASTGPLGASAAMWGIGAGAIFLPLAMLWFGPWMHESGCKTVPQIIEKIYGKKLGFLHACVQTMTWTGIGASETIATGTAIYGLSGGKIPFQPWCILIGFCLIVCYVLFGGLLQMAWLNIINSIVMIIGSYTALFLLGGYLAANLGGWGYVKDFYEGLGTVGKLTQLNLGNQGVWFNIILPVIILHSTAGGVAQVMMQPFFGAKDSQSCRKGVFLGAGINFMSCVPWVCMGLIGMTIPSVVSAGGSNIGKLVVPLLAQEALPAPIVGLLMIALLCATLSTGGGIVLANANVVTTDIIKGALFPNMKDKTEMNLMKVMIIVCAVLLVIPALTVPVVMPVFLWVFSFGMPVFVVFIIGLHWKINRTAAWVTIVVAFIVDLIWTFVPSVANSMPAPFNVNMYAVLLVSIVFGVVLTAILPGKPGLRRQVRMDARAAKARANA
ncbi:sodium:solute symporter family protein [Parasporobacterium paucivorans]|uniref:sodium:solute symporter family protein n=1 Tax=Parasporobacterium paucivorans TaxID=115544 RepID=UPI00093D00DC|nr:sodium:solute symporter family protein [Parasporobacterium paucivorans]